MRDPKAIRKAIMTAKSIASLVDPKFARVPLPDLGVSAPEVYVPEHSPAMHEAFGVPMPKGYAGGGEVEEENPYAKPDDLGLYSHAAVAASNLPKTGTPQQMKEILLRQPGVKPSELHWGEYDYAFGDKPEVSRDEIAKQMWANIPSIEEKVLRKRKPGELSAKEISDKHYKERQSIWDEDLSPAEINQRRREMRERHAAERASAWHHDPYHESYTIPDGENYREILLKHGNGDMFKGVGVHFGGEPDILTSLMVKDRQDREGDKVLHVDELQSDWAQQGRRQGFSGEPSDEAEKRLTDFLASLGQRTGMDVTSMWPHVAMEAANALGERDMLHQLAEERDAERKRNKSIIKPAPYVTKTEDWVDLGLKRALREAAEKGYDKLAWSPGSTIADRYNLAKHVNSISHEKNDDGTYNLSIADPQGGTFFKQDNMSPEKVSSYLGKGVAEKIFAGEGISNDDIRDRESAARKAHLDFLDRLAENDINNRISGIREEYPDHEYSPAHLQMMRDIVLQGVHRDPAHHARAQGLEDEYQAILDELKAASDDYYGLDRGRDYRHLKTDDIQVGEKWPFEMYDRMIPKRALRLAKMHDPDAQLEKSTIEHDDPKGYAGFGSTDLHAIRITPKMRESILKKGFPAYAQGGEVEEHRGEDLISRDPAIAENVPEMSASFASNPATPTKEMSARYIRKGHMEPWREKHPEELYREGAILFPALGDLSMADRLLTHVGEDELVEPVDLTGGGEFQRENPEGSWASRKTPAKTMAKHLKERNPEERPAYMSHTTMGLPSGDSSHMMVQTVLRLIPVLKIPSKALKAFDAKMRVNHPEWPGIANTKAAEDYLLKPKGGKTDYVGKVASDFIKSIDKAGWRDFGFPDIGQARFGITEKRLLSAPQLSSGFSLSRVGTSGKLVENPKKPHLTYSGTIPKEGEGYAGGFKNIVGADKVFSDWYKRQPKEFLNKATGEKQPITKTMLQQALMTQFPSQVANQEWLDKVMPEYEKGKKWGYKKGGTVRKALMIAKGGKKK